MATPATVHPHVRGDNSNRRPISLQATRFTPTCVGTTNARASPQAPGTVHPHVRGDNPAKRCMVSSVSGSPPRAWGQRALQSAGLVVLRFTPTCVGTTHCHFIGL